MLLFCPTCATALLVEEGHLTLRFSCFTCPYVHNIGHVISSRIYPKLKVGICPSLTFRFFCVLWKEHANECDEFKLVVYTAY
jgi:hypothetical protein